MLNLFSLRMDSCSKYRNELMGIATLLVLIVHSFQHRVTFGFDALNSVMQKSLIGVDIFFFVSGVGIYYSLSHDSNVIRFYQRRLKKILPIYIPIFGIFAIWLAYSNDWSVFDYLSFVSTLRVWTHNNGAWFIAVILPLYLLSPLFYKALSGKKSLINAFCICLSIFLISVAAKLCLSPTFSTQIHHFSRSISFVI